jgi:hypothetical protein
MLRIALIQGSNSFQRGRQISTVNALVTTSIGPRQLTVALPRMLEQIEASLTDVKASAAEKWRLLYIVVFLTVQNAAKREVAQTECRYVFISVRIIIGDFT